MALNIPRFLLIFANSPGLKTAKEWENIYKGNLSAMEGREKVILKSIALPETDSVADYLNTPGLAYTVFHFAGHSNATQIYMGQSSMDSEYLAGLLKIHKNTIKISLNEFFKVSNS